MVWSDRRVWKKMLQRHMNQRRTRHGIRSSVGQITQAKVKLGKGTQWLSGWKGVPDELIPPSSEKAVSGEETSSVPDEPVLRLGASVWAPDHYSEMMSSDRRVWKKCFTSGWIEVTLEIALESVGPTKHAKVTLGKGDQQLTGSNWLKRVWVHPVLLHFW